MRLVAESGIISQKSPLEKQTRNGAVHTQSIKIEKKNISTVLIRRGRGGAPSGAVVFILFGGMGVSTPISNS